MTIFRLGNFLLYQLQQSLFQADRSHQQLLILTPQIANAHIPEEHGTISANSIISRQQGIIRIQLGGFCIKITSANMGNIFYPVFLWLPIGNLTQLGMNLIFVKAVKNLTACLPQSINPANIVGLVESSLQLQQNSYILAQFRCHHQIIHQLHMALANSINGNTNGQHIRIVHSLLQQLKKNAKIIVRVTQQHILFFYQIKEVFPLLQMEFFLQAYRSIRGIIQLLLQGFGYIVL